MKNVFVVLIALMMLLLVGCADTYYRQGVTITDTGVTKAVPIKAFQKYSKTVGPGRVVVTNNSVVHEWFDPSPNSPVQRITTIDEKTGAMIVNEIPIVAGSDPSISTIASGNAINRMMHGISNIVGTVFTGWAGLEAAKGLTQVAVAQSNNAASVAKQASRSSAATQQAKIAADVAKQAPATVPAANSIINATTPATVVPIP